MKNFYVLYGLDKSLVQNELEKIIRKLKVEDVVRYDMNTSLIMDVLEDASTVSMFSNKKVIVLENCFFLTANKTIENIEVLEQFIEHYQSDNTCIFIQYTDKLDTRKKVYKLLNKYGTIIELKEKDEGYVKKFIEEYLNNEGYKIEDSSYFIKKVGFQLSTIQNELDKLMMYKIEDKVITNQDIDKISIQSIDEEIFALTDAIVARDIQKSLSLLSEFLNQGYDEIQIIMLLASQFRFFFQVKRLLNKNKSEVEIAKILEVNPYRVKFTVKKLYGYSESMILEYIQKIAKMDHDIKLGLMDKKLALELFIIESNH